MGKVEKAELDYLQREYDEYNKLRKKMDGDAKKGLANELIGNMGHGRVHEDELRRRELEMAQEK